MNDANDTRPTDADDGALPPTVRLRKPRGFATQPKERVREWAGQGGRAAHALGLAHKFSHEEAVAAGRKGGLVSQQRARASRESKP